MDLGKYYEKICREPLLTPDEERDLFLELADQGISEARKQEIRSRILGANLRFVFRQAKYHSRNDPDILEELIGAGNEGLLVGLEKYDPSKGYRFLTYAGWWINQRILSQMGKFRIVALPPWKQQLAAKIAKFLEKNEAATLDDLVAAFPASSRKDLEELSKTRFLTYYISDMGDDPAFEIDPIADIVEAELDAQRIRALVNQLPREQAEVLQLTYGLSDGIELKVTEASAVLGIPKDEVRRLRKTALETLKTMLTT